MKENPYKMPTPNDWRELKILINHEIPTFYEKLVGSGNDLNDFEYDVCMLIRIQISPTNIAKLKKCSPSNITLIRKGIYEKIFKKEGRADDLDEYVMSLS
jgi:hypothetical protein